MTFLFQLILNGLHNGALYALLGYGYVLMRGLTHRTDLAYGAVFAFSGQTLLLASAFGWGALWMTLPVALVFGTAMALVYAGVCGIAIARYVYRPLMAGSRNAILVATLGLSLFLMELSRIAANTRDYWLPPFLADPVLIFGSGATLTTIQLLDLAAVVAFVVFGETVLRATRAGRAWRAVSDDPLAARLCGTDPDVVRLITVTAAALFAAFAGMLATFYYGNISFGTGLVFGLKVLFVTAAGGFTMPLNAAFGAAAIGILESLWTGYFPLVWRDVAVFAFLVVLLVLRGRESGPEASHPHQGEFPRATGKTY